MSGCPTPTSCCRPPASLARGGGAARCGSWSPTGAPPAHPLRRPTIVGVGRVARQPAAAGRSAREAGPWGHAVAELRMAEALGTWAIDPNPPAGHQERGDQEQQQLPDSSCGWEAEERDREPEED